MSLQVICNPPSRWQMIRHVKQQTPISQWGHKIEKASWHHDGILAGVCKCAIQHSLQKLTSTHFQFHSPYSEITQFMAEKLLANIEDDPIPNTKVKRIIRRFTEPYIQHLSFSGVLLPLCGRYNKAHKTPNTPNPNFPVEYSKTKKLHGIMMMASWQGIMWIWNPHSLRELTCTQIHSPYTPELFSEQIRHTAIQLAKSPQKQNWKKSQNSKPETALRKRRLAKLGQFRGRLWGKVGIGSDTHPKKMRVA